MVITVDWAFIYVQQPTIMGVAKLLLQVKSLQQKILIALPRCQFPGQLISTAQKAVYSYNFGSVPPVYLTTKPASFMYCGKTDVVFLQ